MSDLAPIPSPWPTFKLKDIVEFHAGFSFPESDQGLTAGEIPFFKVGDMSHSADGRRLEVADNYVSVLTARSRGWKVCPPGSVAFAKVGVGLLANRRRIIPAASLIDNNMLAISPNREVDPVYLYWLMQIIDFKKLVQDGAVPSVTQAQIGGIEVTIPRLSEQRKIAEILDGVDDSIQSARREVDKISLMREAMSAALLERSDTGRTMAEVLVMNPMNGLYKPASAYMDSGTPIVRIDSIRGGEIDNWGSLRRVDLDAAERDSYKIQVGDILINRVNSIEFVGKSAIVRTLPEPSVFESNIMRCRVSDNLVRPEYIALWLCSPSAMRYFRSCAKSAIAQASINQQDVRSCPIPLLDLPEQDAVVSYFEYIRRKAAVHRDELAKLQLLKQGLMKDLLSGRVRVST